MSNLNAVHDHRNICGAQETAGLVNGQEYHAQRRGARLVDWTTPGLRVTRLRLVSDPGYPYWDVTYCDGQIGDELVKVQLPFSELKKGTATKTLAQQIVDFAIKDGVNAKRMGILGAISKLC